MSTNANFKPLGQAVKDHAALDEKSTLSAVECLKLLEIRYAEKHYTAANLYGTALGIINRQAEDLRRKDAENSRLAQLVCDFQSASMIDVNGQDDPSEITPKHVQDYAYARAAEIERMRAALKPFAAGGGLFTATDESDKSSYVTEPDDAPIGNRICWNATPLTIGDLRRAYKALQPQEADNV